MADIFDAKKRNIVIAVMVAMFLGAVEGTVVTTAMPTIVRDLHGFELISWVFSIYLLASAVTTPIYGKLADLYGRKKTLSIGIIIFVLGSSLCGLSQNMIQLIFFRAIQGLGAGSIFTITYTIVGDVFPLSERARVQGWLGTVWGVASLVGPFVGGFFIDYLSWHWIFFINVPFGILSLVILQHSLTENFEKRRHQIDYAGIALLSFAIMAFLGGLIRWFSFGIFACLMVLFYFTEKKAEEPVIPFEILTKSSIMVNSLGFFASAILMGADVFLPLYIQNVLGFKATVSGLAMAPMSLAWLISAVLLAKAIPRYGERLATLSSFFVLLLSCVLLAALRAHSSLLLVVICIFLMGFGFGGGFTTLTIIIQESVEYRQRGAATALNSLVRTLGQTIGVSVLGSLLNLYVGRHLSRHQLSGALPDFSAGSGVPAAALYFSLHGVFLALLFLSFVCCLLSFFLPSRLKQNLVLEENHR